jgi:hypothetical protein
MRFFDRKPLPPPPSPRPELFQEIVVTSLRSLRTNPEYDIALDQINPWAAGITPVLLEEWLGGEEALIDLICAKIRMRFRKLWEPWEMNNG